MSDDQIKSLEKTVQALQRRIKHLEAKHNTDMRTLRRELSDCKRKIRYPKLSSRTGLL